jgi:hypothetical protein
MPDVDADRVGEGERFEQGVTCEAVRAMQSGKAAFSERVELADVRAPMRIDDNSATGIVRRRNDRDRLARHIVAVRSAGFEHVRKTLADHLPRLVADV